MELLLTKNREDKNLTAALDQYKDVQQSIVSGTELELYGDVPRLLPERMRPECLEMVMEIIPYEREERKTGLSSRQASSKSGGAKKKGPKKRTRDSDEDTSPAKRMKAPDSEPEEELKPKKRSTTLKRAKSAPEEAPIDLQFAKVLPRTLTGVNSPSHTTKVTTLKASKAQNIRKESTDVTKAASSKKASMDWLLESDQDSELDEKMRRLANKAKNERPKEVIEAIINLSSGKEESDVEVVGDIQLSSGRPVALARASSSRPPVETIANSSSPEILFPIRRPAKSLQAKPQAPTEDLSQELSSPVLRRIKRKEDKDLMPPPPIPDLSTSPVPGHRRLKGTKRSIKRSILDNPDFLEIEAIHSGDDVDAGSSDSEGMANSSDREFVVDVSATQVASDYDQSAIYRQGLFTQVPTGGPVFANRPVRAGYLGRGRGTPVFNRQILPSSSPDRDTDLDHYSLGSFVVDDDDEIIEDDSAEA